MTNIFANKLDIWTNMYTESLTEKELSESTSDEDIINTAFSTLLYFLCSEGKIVLNDEEWMLYLINDINNAIQKGMFKPAFEDKQRIKKIQDMHFGKDESEETDTED